MTSRKLLKGVAYNLAQWCLSRNNDYHGYWAVGQLYEFSKENEANKVVVNVLKETVVPSGNKFRELCENHLDLLNKISSGYGVESELLKEVIVEYAFEVPYAPEFHYFGSALGGEPSMCRVLITSNNGNKYCAEIGCNVWTHNPKRESRR